MWLLLTFITYVLQYITKTNFQNSKCIINSNMIQLQQKEILLKAEIGIMGQ